jgi:hypothetical protein
LPPNREKNFQANSPPNKPKINQNLPPNQVKISPNQQPSKQTKIVNFGLETNHLATLLATPVCSYAELVKPFFHNLSCISGAR